jgi:hypothetical protein
MDTTGHVGVPPEYFNLAIFEDYQLLTAQTAAGNYVLLSIEGKKIHTFQSAPSGIAIQKIGRTEDGKSTGLMVAYSSKETLLLDKSGAVVQQYNWPFSRETLPEIMAQRYLILLKNNHTVWVDFRSGQRFFE